MEVNTKRVHDLTQEPRTQVRCGDSAKTIMIMIVFGHIMVAHFLKSSPWSTKHTDRLNYSPHLK